MKLIKVITIASLLMTNLALAEVAVIVNPANGSSIDQAEIIRIFMGKQHTFASGVKAVPLNLMAASPARGEFEANVLKKSASRLKSYWSKMLFAGRGTAPAESSAQDVLSQVNSDPQAIGYIDATSVTAAVKVVARF